MDFDFSFILFLTSTFVFVFIFIFIFALFKTTKYSNKNLPPGPRKLPFIGNLHLLSGSAPPHHVLANLATKHGPLMHLKLGEISALVVSTPETAEHFLKANDAVFSSRPSLLAPEINCYGNTDIAFAPYGDYWRQLRKICSLQLFTAKRVGSFRPIRKEEVSNLCKSVAMRAGEAINLTEKVAAANLNIMVKAAFGKKSDGEVFELNSIIKEAQEFVTCFNVVDVYPSWRLLRVFSGMRRKIERHHELLDKILESIIKERRNARGNDEGDGDGDGNLLDVLLRLQGDGSLQIPLTTDNIKSVLMDGAGVESSTTATDWAMAEMLKNPRVLKKAQDEVRSVFDGKNQVDESHFHELKYLKLVIKETLRLHPPVPLLLPRESREHCVIDRYQIPAKTWVLVNAWAIGRDPNQWEDPESFKPERFLEKQIDFKANNTFQYIPFGGGRRICPAIGFGIANIEIQMAMLLYHFDWILPHGIKPKDLDMKESSGLSGKRKCDLTLIPVVKRPLLQ
ncbi:salviol synthase-like [Salvia splendens]|uniref:salviol synthase-like n=1 Tax=Salvia splendens TaxID=180675 RepID=UPI001C252871|nr:salviol synthase-like [Salvia splendens]